MKKINLTEYIRKSGEHVSLSDIERERMKRVLSEYIAMKPLRNVPLDRRAPISYMLLSLYAFSRKSVALLLVAGILFSGAGVSFAAENALPGDALYPIKVEVNEPVVAVLSVSSESKALWNAELAERRLEEAAKLASDDALTDEAKEELENRFEKHAERFVVDVERLEASEASIAADVATRFENTLLAHEVVLADVEHPEKVRNLKDQVRTKIARLARVTERVSGVPIPSATVAVLSEPAPEATTMMMSVAMDTGVAEGSSMKARAASVAEEAPPVQIATVSEEVVQRFARSAKKEFQNASRLFERLEERIDEDARMRVNGELSEIKTLMSSADQAVSQNDFALALASYRKAATISVKLSVFLKAFQKSRLKVIPREGASGDFNENAVIKNTLPIPVQIQEPVSELGELAPPERVQQEKDADTDSE
ncbi:hypothetical protein K2P56_03825 [Patescibacteria group bacterium]|nr:hypothetical protein [Patescibacteria group bacterium]